jgi:hypothetical protein
MRWRRKTKGSRSQSKQSLSGEVTSRPTTPSSGLTPTRSTEAESKETTRAETKPTPSDGEIYADFIEKELTDLRSSKTSLEQRALAVVSASGVVIALLFGFATIGRQSSDVEIPSSARIFFYLALGAFALAVVSALVANFPSKLQAAKTAALEAVLRDNWRDSESVARRRIAVTRLKLYGSYRRGNKRKAIGLMVAVAGEVLAVLFLAVAIGLVIASA